MSIEKIVDTDDVKNDIVKHCFDNAVPVEISKCRTPGDISIVTGHHSPCSNENCVHRNVRHKTKVRTSLKMLLIQLSFCYIST